MERDRRFGTFPMQGKTRGAWLATTALSMLSLSPAAHAQGIAANTTPQGGTVTAGSANISQGAASTIITQSSERAAINWQSFNVGSAASVKFAQPDASAIALNRVVTPDPSIIAGRIDANGQIVLINQSGVVFTRGSQVNAESIFVSTSNIADKDFMAGKLNFSGPPNPGAAIVNNGQLTAKQAGLVGLVAPQVINNGVITAELGQVVLAGASAFTLDLYGDRLISLDVTKAVSQVDLGGKLTPALVTNRGIILADGGKITLTAADADALVTELIQAGGTMRADSLGAAKGAITLQAVGGNIEIAGNLLARGGAAGTSGGTILAAATGTIAMAPGAVADVSGAAGGGQIALGAAQGSIAPAAAVSISSGATLRADATHSGNGGSVLLDSQDNTAFDGAISVQGGPQGGNGGSADISGGVVSLSGTVLDTAINGKAGEVILDPVTLVVGTGTPGAGITTSGGDTIIGGGDSTATSYISPGALDSLTGTIVLSASSLITVASAIDVSQASALSLVSGGAVTISAGVTSGGSLEIDATTTIEIDAPLSGTDVALNTAGDATEGTGGGIAAQTLNSSISGELALDGSNSIAALGNVEADDGITLSNAGPLAIAGGVNTGGNFSLGDSGAVTELSTGTINANELDTDPGPIAGALVLTGNNTIDILGNVSATGNIALVDEQQVSDPSLFVSNPLTIAGMISTPGSFSLDDNGAVMETGGLIDAAEFDTGSGSITGDLLLTGNNTIAALGNVTASGTAGIALVNGQALDLDGILSTPGSFSLNNDGAVTENAGGAIDATEFDTDGATIAGFLALGESNTIGTLGDVAAAGAFTLVNSTSLDVAGAVRAPEIALAIDGLLSVNGALAAPQGGEVQLAVLGLDFGTAGSISAPGGTIAVAPYDNGTLDVGGDTAGGLELSGSVLDALQDTGTLILGKALGSIANSVLVEGTLSFSVVSLALDSSGPVENTGTLRGDDIALAGSTLQNDGSLFATLLSFMTPGDFLSDGDMSIGTLSGSVGNDLSFGGANNTFGTLGAITAGTITVEDGQSLDIAGTISTGSFSLDADGAVTELTGSSIDATEFDSDGRTINGALALGQSNTIGTLGDVAASGDIALADAQALSIAGTVFTAGSFSLDDSSGAAELPGGAIDAAEFDTDGKDAGTLGLTGFNTIASLGGVTAGSGITLVNDEALTLANVVFTSGSFSLADTGAVTEASGGVIHAAEFDSDGGTIGGALALTGANSIAALGALDATGNIVLVNNGPLDIDDTVQTPGSFSLSDSGSVTEMGGAIDAAEFDTDSSTIGGALQLAGGNSIAALGDVAASGNIVLEDAQALDLAGIVSTPGDFSLADSGAVTELTGSAIDTAEFDTDGGRIGGALELGQNNSIATLSAVTASGGITLVNAPALTLTSTISTPDDFSLADSGAVTEQSGSGIDAAEFDSDGTTIGGGLSLGQDNAIGTLGDIATSGDITLTDGEALSIAGTVFTTGSFSLGADDGVTELPGGVVDAAEFDTDGKDAGTLELAGFNTIATLGGVTASNGITLVNTQVLTLANVIFTSGSFSLADSGAVTEASGGVIDAAEFDTDHGTIGGALALAQGNSIGTLGDIAATGNITLVDNAPLDIDGVVFTPGSFSLGDRNSVTEISGGGIDAAEFDSDGGTIGGALSLNQANTIATLGVVAADGDITLADRQALTIAGTVSTSDSFSLRDSGAVTEAGGVIDAAEFDSDGGTIGGALQLGGGNAVGTFGNVAATGDISFANDGTLNLAGTVATPGIFALAATGAVTELSGSAIDATEFDTNGTTIGGALSLGQNNAIGTLGDIAANGDITLVNTQALSITGTVITPDSFALGNDGDVTEAPTAGIRAAAFDTDSEINGTLTLPGANTIASLGGVTTSGGITLANGEALTLAGIISTTGSFSLNDSGAVTEISGGVIDAAEFDTDGGTIAGALQLDQGNAVGTFGNVAAAGDITFANDGMLNLAGTVATPGIFALGATGAVTELSGGVIDAAGFDTNGETIGGALVLNQDNSIGTLGVVAVAGAFSVQNGTNLDVDALVQAQNITLVDQGALGLNNRLEVTTGGTVQIAAAGMTLGQGGEILAPSGTIAIAPYGNWTLDIAGSSAGGLELSALLLDALDPSASLTLGSATGYVADSILSEGNVSLGAPTLALVTSGLFDNTGDIAGQFVTLSGANLENGGTIGATSLDFTATDDFTGDGSIDAGTVAGGAGTLVSLTGANAIGTLGIVSVTSGGITLEDAPALDLAGIVSTPDNFSLTDSGGAVTELAGSAIDAAEFDTDGGRIGGALELGQNNSIATLGAVTASGGITLVNAPALTLASIISTPDDFSLDDSGAVTELAGSGIDAAEFDSAGATIGGALALNQDNAIGTLGGVSATGNITLADTEALAITGSVSTPGSFSLKAGGAVTELSGGVIDAAEFDSDGGSITGVLALGQGNSIATLGNVTSSGNITLVNDVALDIDGAVSTPGSFSLGDSGAVTETGGAIDAAEFDSHGGTIGGVLALTGGNSIAALGAVAASGNIVLADARALDLTGLVSTPGSFSLGASGAVTETGGVIHAAEFDSDGATTGGALALTGGNSIATLGNVAASGNIVLKDAQALDLTGLVSTPGSFSLGDSGAVTETGGAIDAAEFDTDGATTGGVLELTGGNRIASLGNVAASGNIVLANGGALTIGGDVTTPGSLSLQDSGAVTELPGGVVDAAEFDTDGGSIGGALVLDPDNEIGTLGGVAAAGNIVLTNGQGLVIAGQVVTPGDFSLYANGAVTELPGSGIDAAEFDTDGATIGGALQLTGANLIGALGNVAAGGNITLLDNEALNLGGTVFTPGNFSLGDTGGVTETGAIDAAEFDTDGGRIGGALVLTGNNLFGVLGGVAASGNISVSNGEALDLAGVIATPGIFSLDNNGPVTEVQNSVIDAGEFDTDGGITNGALVLTNLNQIGTLGGISASGDILMTNNEALEIAGIVYTPVIFSLDNNGPVTEVQGGGMNVGEFDTDGGDDGALQLNGPNSIGTLGGVTSSSSISLTENGNMVFTGPVIAAQLTLTVNGQLTLQGSPDGGLFVNGTLAPNSQTMPSSQDSVITVNDTGRPEIIQNGIFYINSKPGGATTGPATLFMNAPQSGGIQFAAFPQGLYAPSVDLVLRAGPFGTVTGNVTLAHLSILSAASATLTGSIQGVGGQPAAGKGTVLPNPLPVYQINSCPIGSVNCVLLQIESVPPDNPLQNFDISVPKRRRLNARISLPGIATRDY